MNKKTCVAVSIGLACFAIPGGLRAQQAPDTTDIPKIATPRYPRGGGSTICIDGAHNNLHRLSTGFAPFAAFLRNDGYRVVANDQSFAEGVPEECDIHVIANALHQSNLGHWVLPTPSAFSEAEISNLESWVSEGGSLFLIADHMPYPGAAEGLGQAFGFEFNNGFALRRAQSWPPAMFTKSNETLRPSPVTQGIDSVATYTGQAFRIPPEATPVLVFDEEHYTLMPDTAWVFNDNTPQESVAGWSQGAIMNFGDGRVAVFGEAAMFTAQTAGPQRQKVGITDAQAPQNARFLLNVIHWLDLSNARR